MANHDYIISEVKFFQEEKENVKSFLSGTGINLDEPCSSIIPTLTQIEEKVLDYGMKFERENSNIIVKNSKGENMFHLILEKDVGNDSKISIFEIRHGSDIELLIDFFKFISQSFGKFLLYSDTGQMALITHEVSVEQVLQEFYH